jgi:glycogen operon protein
MTTLMLSQGVPMIVGGDELGQTHLGNNNVYCQDNELSWYPWHDVDADFVRWCQRVIEFRRSHPVFRRRRWFQGRRIRGIEDLAWFRPDGQEMTDDDWATGYARAVGVFVNGQSIPTTDAYGEKIVDDTFLLLFNAGHEPLTWNIPGPEWGRRWTVDLDTSNPRIGVRRNVAVRAEEEMFLLEHSMMVLRSTRPPARRARRRPAPPTDTAEDAADVRAHDDGNAPDTGESVDAGAPIPAAGAGTIDPPLDETGDPSDHPTNPDDEPVAESTDEESPR